MQIRLISGQEISINDAIKLIRKRGEITVHSNQPKALELLGKAMKSMSMQPSFSKPNRETIVVTSAGKFINGYRMDFFLDKKEADRYIDLYYAKDDEEANNIHERERAKNAREEIRKANKEIASSKEEYE